MHQDTFIATFFKLWHFKVRENYMLWAEQID